MRNWLSSLLFPMACLQALTWQTPFPLEEKGFPISDSYYGYTYPSCSITSDGYGIASWISAIDFSTNYQIHVAIEGEGGWGPNQVVMENVNGTKPMFGNIYAAAGNPDGHFSICAPVFDGEAIAASFVWWNGTAWSSPISLSGLTDIITTPSISINPSGDIAVSWIVSNELSNGGSAIRRSGEWEILSGMLPEGGTITMGPCTGIDGSSEALSFWTMYLGEGFSAQAASENGAGWTGRETFTSSSPSVISPSLSVADSGFTTACWVESDGDYWDLKAAIHSGGTWSSPAIMTQLAGTLPRSPQTAASYDGKAVLVWHEMNGEDVKIMGSTYSGSAWSSPTVIHTFETSYMQLELKTAITDGGNAAVLAVADAVIYSAEFSTETGWGWIGMLSGVGETCANPNVAANRNGDVFSVWERQALDGTWSTQGLKGSL